MSGRKRRRFKALDYEKEADDDTALAMAVGSSLIVALQTSSVDHSARDYPDLLGVPKMCRAALVHESNTPTNEPVLPPYPRRRPSPHDQP